jgi:hypothetical protein
LLAEFEAALSRNQIAWAEQAKGLAQQSLNAGLRVARDSTALMLEEATQMNAAAVRKAFKEGAARMEETIGASRRIAWMSLAAAVVAFVESGWKDLGLGFW